jgi:cell division septation protein DedD
MIATRRLGRVRHEFRFGTRELVVIGVVFCLITGLVFAGGVLVGRETARGKRTARVEVVPESRSDGEALRQEAPVKTAATRAEEKVTFYRTLTAPTTDLPQVGKPAIEEQLIPKEDPAPSAQADPVPGSPKVAPEPPRAAPERRISKATEPAASPRPVRTARAPAAPSAAPPRSGPAQLVGPAPGAEGDAWTVQVSAFRSRALAEELRSRLAARGFDAHVFPSLTEDGRPRYRVRVGAYASRGDAERVAAELRSERGLNPLVTSARTR